MRIVNSPRCSPGQLIRIDINLLAACLSQKWGDLHIITPAFLNFRAARDAHKQKGHNYLCTRSRARADMMNANTNGCQRDASLKIHFYTGHEIRTHRIESIYLREVAVQQIFSIREYTKLAICKRIFSK